MQQLYVNAEHPMHRARCGDWLKVAGVLVEKEVRECRDEGSAFTSCAVGWVTISPWIREK